MSERMTSLILDNVADGGGTNFLMDELTGRELSVVQMLGQGRNVEETKARLDLARKTVGTYRRRAEEKLEFEKGSELLQFAILRTYAGDAPEEMEGTP